MRPIFISYRREDTQGEAGRLCRDLRDHYGETNVFIDVTGIDPGADFRDVIRKHADECGVLLAMIGRRWLTATTTDGQTRLHDPRDFVRLETAAALKRSIPVVPVLVQDATMPDEAELPEDLKSLAYRNAVELTHARWDTDVQVLVEKLDRALATQAGTSRTIHKLKMAIGRRKGLLSGFGLTVIGGGTMLAYTLMSRPEPDLLATAPAPEASASAPAQIIVPKAPDSTAVQSASMAATTPRVTTLPKPAPTTLPINKPASAPSPSAPAPSQAASDVGRTSATQSEQDRRAKELADREAELKRREEDARRQEEDRKHLEDERKRKALFEECLVRARTAYEQKVDAIKKEVEAKHAVQRQQHDQGICLNGFVWREARAGDKVCVTPQIRAQTWDENKLAPQNRMPSGGAYGPNTCKQGYVWREAFSGDVACVVPKARDNARLDNAQASQRIVPVPDATPPLLPMFSAQAECPIR